MQGDLRGVCLQQGGQVYHVKGSQTTGSEQAGGRPAVIVNNDVGNSYSTIAEIVYLTMQKKPNLPTHVPIHSTARPSTTLCEQIQTVCKDRLYKYIGTVSAQEMAQIDEALLISLGLKAPCKKGKQAVHPQGSMQGMQSARQQKTGTKQPYRV